MATNKFGKAVLIIVLIACVGFGIAVSIPEKLMVVPDQKIRVVASFYPMADFTKKIGGDKVEVSCLIPEGSEPHLWEPSPHDVKTLSGARLFVYNGVGLEPWAQQVLSSLGKDAPESVEASKGVSLLKVEHHHGSEEEVPVKGGSKDDHHEDSTKDHDHDHSHDHDTHHHGAYDPHVWLNPLNAKIEMKNICESLCKIDPQHKAYYESNYAEQAKKLDVLNQTYKDTLLACPKKQIVVAHEAFGYICQAYGLQQIGIEGLEPDAEPDAKRMKEIVNLVQHNGISTIFYEEMVSPKVAKQIAQETGAQAEVLNPIEGLTKAQQAEGQDYFSIMYANLGKLKGALS